MKQVVQNMKNGETRVIDVPVPCAGKGQLLVHTAASLVSAGTERNLVAFAEKGLIGKARSRPDLFKQAVQKAKREGPLATLESALNRLDQPLALGYSSAGTVIAVGSGVSAFKVGDRVACAGGGHAVHAEYASVPVNLTVPLPPDVNFKSGAFATLGAIALNGIRLAKPQVGERTAIIGLGLLGLITAQIMRAAGCEVIGIDVNPIRVKYSQKIGFQSVLNKDIPARYLSFTQGRGFDHVLICADTPADDTVELAGMITRDRGYVISLGVVGLNLPRKPFFEKEIFFQVSRSSGPGRYDPVYEEKGVDYPLGYVRWTEGRNMEAFLELIQAGSVSVEPLITHSYTIAEAEKAYELITGKKGENYLGVILTYPLGENSAKAKVTLRSEPEHSGIASEVNLGVIGAGLYANATFLPAAKKDGRTRLIGIASTGGLSAQHSGRKFGFQFAASAAEEIFDHTGINTVAILTRHHSHAGLTVQALKAGKHVYCEKPLAITTDQAADIKKLLSKGMHPYLMVGFNRRFAHYSEKMKTFFTDTSEPIYASIRVNAGYLPPTHWQHDPEVGGGRLIGEGCHFIDYLSFIIGKHPVSANVIGLPDEGKYRGDNFFIRLVYPDGSIGTVAYLSNGSPNLPKEYYEVFSAGKVAILDDFRFLQLIDQNRIEKYVSRFRQDKGHIAAWNAFTKAITTDGQEPIPYADILSSMYATLACDQSLRNGEEIDLAEFMAGA